MTMSNRDNHRARGLAAGSGFQSRFARLATIAAPYSGRPATFLVVVGLVVVRALSGPLFGFSECRSSSRS